MEWSKIARRPRGQAGFSTMGALTVTAGIATLGALIMMNGTEQVAAAEATACQYEKRVVMTAVDSYRVMDSTLAYPWPAGVDGLDAVREAGWLRTEATYWKYTGAGTGTTPTFELLKPVPDCA